MSTEDNSILASDNGDKKYTPLNKTCKAERFIARQLQFYKNNVQGFFSAENRIEKFKIIYHDKKYFNSDNEPLKGLYFYVMVNGKMYASSKIKGDKLFLERHYFLTKGNGVSSLGYCEFSNGVARSGKKQIKKYCVEGDQNPSYSDNVESGYFTDTRNLPLNYIDDNERPKYEMKNKAGIFTNANGELLNGKYNYVRLLDNKVYISPVNENAANWLAHHSYLANGKKVSSAGVFEFVNGKMTMVNNQSGHYTPNNQIMQSDLMYYFMIAKNNDLIYEDHSRHPFNHEIDQYQLKDVIVNDFDLKLCNRHTYEDISNFGAKLIENDLPDIPDDGLPETEMALKTEPLDIEGNSHSYNNNYSDEIEDAEEISQCRLQ